MNRLFKRVLFTAGALIAFSAALVVLNAAGLPNRATYTGQITDDQQVIAPEIGALAPNFSTITYTGEPFTLDSTQGNPVVINFWATWCQPCAVEMPELQSLHEAYPEIQLVGVNLSESPFTIAEWMERGGYTYPVVLDPSGEIAALYALRGQPTTIILSPGGMILQIFYGATTRAALEGVLAPFLG